MKHGGLLVEQPPCFISKLMSKKLKVNSIQKMGLFYTIKNDGHGGLKGEKICQTSEAEF